MAETVINIRISGEVESNQSAPTDIGVKPNSENPTKVKQGTTTAKNMITYDLAKTAGKNLLSLATSRVEMFTGSSELQKSVNLLQKGIGYGIAFAINPALAALALTTELIGTAIDYTHTTYWNGRAADLLRQRTGDYSTQRGR